VNVILHFLVQPFLWDKLLESVETKQVPLQALLISDLDYDDYDNIHSVISKFRIYRRMS